MESYRSRSWSLRTSVTSPNVRARRSRNLLMVSTSRRQRGFV